MNRSLTLGLLGLATAASIGVHLYQSNQPRYIPRDGGRSGQIPDGQWEWLNRVRANVETGLVEPADHQRMAKAVAAYVRSQRKIANYEWVEMGPDNVGGRVRGICIDPANSQTLWAGSVSGGLFRSFDGANTWQRIPSFAPNLMVSSIAILGNGHLYVATGNAWEGGGGFGSSGFSGLGLFRSDNNGDSFTQVLGPTSPWGGGDWTRINRIKADPTNAGRLYIAASSPGARIYDEATNSASNVGTGIPATTAAYDVEVSGDGQTILYSAGTGDAYRSIDGGQTFEKLDGTPGVGFPQSAVGRLELAISPDNPDYMYAIGATTSGRMSGVWSSTDRGNNWYRIWPHNYQNDDDAVPELDIFRDNQQGNYDNAIAVRPGHPDEVWIGGVELWKTTLSGQPGQLAQADGTPGCFFCVHSDVHEIVFADELNGYIGCDGGVYKTPNGGFNFYACNRDLSITQFYSVAYNAKGHVAGGTQDNGTKFIDGYGNTPNEASTLTGGDGFDCDLSLLDTNIMFTSIYNGEIYRSNDQGNNFGEFYDASVPVNPDAQYGAGLGDFYTNLRLSENPKDLNSPDSVKRVFHIDTLDMILPGQTRAVPFRGAIFSVQQYGEYTNPSLTDTIKGPWDSDTLLLQDQVTSMFAVGFTTNQGVWMTRDAMNFNMVPAWANIAGNAGGNVTCLEFSADMNHLFYGTSEGDVYRISGLATAYGLNELSVDSPGYALTKTTILSTAGVVTGLAPDPTYSDVLVVTFGGYGGNSKVRRTLHALDATVSASDWDNIWNVPGELQGMPCYDACIHKDNGNIIAVGTEFGIWVTDDAGQSWTNQLNGIQGVPVFAMRQQTWNWQNNPWGPDYVTNPNVIYAGTHGRGIYRTESLVSIPPIGEGTTSTIEGLLMIPNPASTQSVVSFMLARQGDVTVNVYDLRGALVRTVTRKNLSAAHQNIPIALDELGTGTYLVEVRSADQRRTGRLVVAR